MSRIAILGASGNLGGLLLTYALGAGWQVHALTRDPRRIRKANENLTVYKGDLERGEGLESFVTGCRFVLYAVTSAHTAECMAQLVRAIGWKKMDRLVFVSRLGVGDSDIQARKASGMLASLMPRVRRGLYDDIGHAEELLRLSGLPYSIFRTTELTDDAPGHELAAVKAQSDELPSRVGRADLARFIIQSLEDPGWNLQEVTVGTRRRHG
jgi:uncharacterized protein YbjT (DUF2867 family)